MMWAFYGCSALTEIDGLDTRSITSASELFHGCSSLTAIYSTLDTPAKWNSVCREAIWRNYDLMRPHTQLLFHDYFTERYGAKKIANK